VSTNYIELLFFGFATLNYHPYDATMKPLLGYVLLAISIPLVLGISGFIYGWLCALVARSTEQLETQRRIDMKLWTLIGPGLAVVILGTIMFQGQAWYLAVGYAAIGWAGCLLFKGGLYWAIARRLKADATPPQ